jgi:curli biogenesis system outer membrane secretion channel CsgG
MMPSKFKGLLFLLIGLPLLLFPEGAMAQKKIKKKRIAVFTFEDMSRSGFAWYNQLTIGEGLSDMIVTELVQSELYTVLERDRLNALLREQDLGAIGVVTPESAAAMGKVLGVELAVFGSITEFGNKGSNTGVNIPATGIRVGKQTAVTAVDIRVVDTGTGEILKAESVRSEKSAVSGGVRIKNFRFDNRDQFDSSLIGKATREAVEDVIDLINGVAESTPWSAKVIMMQGDKVYINSGSQDGVEVGEVFEVFREGEALIDPDTGLSLGSISSRIGSIRVVDVSSIGEGKAAICEIVEGSNFEKGDIVKEK